MRRWPKPSQVVLALGVLMALFVIVSGIVPALTHWSDDSPIQREVFINVATPVKVAFYGSVATMLLTI